MRTKRARVANNDWVRVEKLFVISLFVLCSTENDNQNGYADNDKNRINGDKIRDEVDLKNGDHSR